MKRTNLRRLLPILLTLVIAIVCIFGITAAATTTPTIYSYEIKYASVVLNNNVDLIFWADLDEETAQNNDTFMTFNDGAPVFYSTTESVNGNTYIVYRCNDILPQDIGKPVTAKLYIDGELSSFSIYNVKDYCQYVLTYSSSDTLKTLVSDLLVYGASIQELLGEDPANYVTSGIKNLSPSWRSDDMTVLFGTDIKDNLGKGETVTVESSKIRMTNGMELLVDFNFLDEDVDISEYSACLTINGREQEVKIAPEGHVYRAVFNAFYPYELFENVQVDVYKGNARVSKSFTLSLASYLDALSENDTYAKAVSAYYNYGYSTHLYGGTHTIAMPGTVEANGMGTSTYDDYGTVTYSCSLCGVSVERRTVRGTEEASCDPIFNMRPCATDAERKKGSFVFRHLPLKINYRSACALGVLGFYERIVLSDGYPVAFVSGYRSRRHSSYFQRIAISAYTAYLKKDIKIIIRRLEKPFVSLKFFRYVYAVHRHEPR